MADKAANRHHEKRKAVLSGDGHREGWEKGHHDFISVQVSYWVGPRIDPTVFRESYRGSSVNYSEGRPYLAWLDCTVTLYGSTHIHWFTPAG